MEARASPRKPKVAMVAKSSKVESFDVVNLWQTMGRSARLIPVPLSLIWISFRPPSPRTTVGLKRQNVKEINYM